MINIEMKNARPLVSYTKEFGGPEIVNAIQTAQDVLVTMDT